MDALSLSLFGRSLTLDAFPKRATRVLGLSDSENYAKRLAHALAYTNTFFHQEPKLDITKDTPAEHGKWDVVLCSEVLEHVAPPRQTAFDNLFALLKPKGRLILTVPFLKYLPHREHYPHLYSYSITRDKAGRTFLLNTRRSGKREFYKKLVFHGGEGATLEMRTFSRRALRKNLVHAGFSQISFYLQDNPRFGIYLGKKHSVPVTALKP